MTKYLALALLVLSLAFAMTVNQKNKEIASLNLKISSAELQASQTTVQRQESTRSVETGLNTFANQGQTKLNEKIFALTKQRDVALKWVRDSQANQSTGSSVVSNPSVTGDGQASSGDPGERVLSQLGEEDVEEAFRGDTIREHLLTCYQQYDEARASLAKLASAGGNQ